MNGTVGCILNLLDETIELNIDKIEKEIKEIFYEYYENTFQNQYRLKNYDLYLKRVNEIEYTLNLTKWRDKYSFIDSRDRTTIGYYNFGIKDKLQSIDNYIEDIKLSQEYKEYINPQRR